MAQKETLSMFNFKRVFPLVLGILLFGTLVGSVVVLKFLKKENPPQVSIAPVEGRDYFADEVFIYGDDNGKPFYLSLSLNRLETDSGYSHYYYVKGIYDKSNINYYTDFTNSGIEPINTNFLTNYKRFHMPDLSAREDLEFLVLDRIGQIKINVSNLNGDFLVKNSIEYTKYVSEGDAQVQINGKSFRANAVFINSYSNNAYKYVYFDNFDGLVSRTVFGLLWDELGNFYLLDRSDVETTHKYYTSHAWGLKKDTQTNELKKAFGFDITRSQNLTYKINIPAFNNLSLNLTKKQTLSSILNEFLVEGTTSEGSIVKGYFHDHYYGKE